MAKIVIRELFDFLRNNRLHGKKFVGIKPTEEEKKLTYNFVIERLSLKNTEITQHLVKETLRLNFFNRFALKVKELPRNKKNFNEFEEKNQAWLSKELLFDIPETTNQSAEKRGKKIIKNIYITL